MPTRGRKYPLQETEKTAHTEAPIAVVPEPLMPSYWSNKDERQYKHVKHSELAEGRSEKRAEQIAGHVRQGDDFGTIAGLSYLPRSHAV